MTWVALKSLAARRLRAGLTALADRAGRGHDRGQPHPHRHRSIVPSPTIFSSSYAQTDLVVTRDHPAVDESFAGTPHRPGRPAAAHPGAPRRRGGGRQPGQPLRHREHRQDPRPRRRGRSAATARTSASASTRPTSASTRSRLTDGRLGVRPARGRHRRRHGRRPRLRRRRPRRRRRRRPGARLHRHAASPASAASTRIGGATIAVFDVATARSVLGKTGFDAIQVAAAPGTSAGELGRRIEAILPPSAELTTGDEQAASDKEVVSEGIDLHPRHPARLRRHRAVRGRLRHLQHAVHHGGPAHARARHAAHPRRVAPAGAALGDRRGRRHRPRGVARRPGPGPRARQGADGALRRRRASPCPRGDTVFETRTVVVSLLVGTARHPAGRPRARHPRDPGPADRRRPRGRDAPAGAALAAHPGDRPRGDRRGRGRCSPSACSATAGRPGAWSRWWPARCCCSPASR